jgi:hypothetical protein
MTEIAVIFRINSITPFQYNEIKIGVKFRNLVCGTGDRIT